MPRPRRDFRKKPTNSQRTTDLTEKQGLQQETRDVSVGNASETRRSPEPEPPRSVSTEDRNASTRNGERLSEQIWQTTRQNTDTTEVAEERMSYDAQHNKNYVDFIWDVTYSSRVICSAVYPEIRAALDEMEEVSRRNPDKEFYIGLTLFHGEHGENGLPNNQPFGTVGEMREALQQVEFYGGSSLGYEDLYAALDFSMEKLRNTDPYVNRHVILISDSTVPEGTQSQSYDVGLRTALMYVNMRHNNRQFRPSFKIVDREGNEVESVQRGPAAANGRIPVEEIWNADPRNNDSLRKRAVGICTYGSALSID